MIAPSAKQPPPPPPVPLQPDTDTNSDANPYSLTIFVDHQLWHVVSGDKYTKIVHIPPNRPLVAAAIAVARYLSCEAQSHTKAVNQLFGKIQQRASNTLSYYGVNIQPSIKLELQLIVNLRQVWEVISGSERIKGYLLYFEHIIKDDGDYYEVFVQTATHGATTSHIISALDD